MEKSYIPTRFTSHCQIAQNSSHLSFRNEREVAEFRKLNREKSFDEARTAVQSQIERMFQKAAGEGETASPLPGHRR